MGHQRLGKLPAHRLLPEIVKYLVEGGVPTQDLVDQVTEFGQSALEHALKDPMFIEALWLLIQMPQAAASRNFISELAAIGITDVASSTDILASYTNALTNVRFRHSAGMTDLGEIASAAALSALSNELRTALPTLWTPTAADIWAPVAALKAPERFATLAHGFYANFVERVIHYYVDRNLHKMVGADRVVRSINDLESFNSAIRRHCSEAALIMKTFARDWLAKNLYRDGKNITRKDVHNFSAYTVKKLEIELNMRKGVP